VNRVEAFGLGAGHVDLLQRDRTKTGFLELRDDLADEVTTDGIRLDDGEGAFERHGVRSLSGSVGKVAPCSVRV
jgi:hypothetical protein